MLVAFGTMKALVQAYGGLMAGLHQNFGTYAPRDALRDRSTDVGLGIAESAFWFEGQIDTGSPSARKDITSSLTVAGNLKLKNCVVLCKSCHYSVHAGGNYRTTARYGFVGACLSTRKSGK